MARMTKYTTKLTSDKRVVLEKEVSMNYPGENFFIKSPEDAVIICKKHLHIHEGSEEYMYMICISHGNVNSSIVGAREIFQKALLANAVSIILAHNHPSGDPTPSREDVEVTKRIVEAGKILGVQLLDHLIIGDQYVSLKEKGHM